MTDQAYGHQIDIPEPVDSQFVREGGQTDYRHLPDDEPFDKVSIAKRKFENRFIDLDLTPVPVAAQEDRSLVVYDYVQKQYNVTLAGGLVPAGKNELDVVEDGWIWLPDRVAIFGTATGFVKLYDGVPGDDSQVFATQAGVAALLGGVQSITGVMMTQRTPLNIVTVGADATAQIAVGLWYRKAKWVWTPSKVIRNEDVITQDPEARTKIPVSHHTDRHVS